MEQTFLNQFMVNSDVIMKRCRSRISIPIQLSVFPSCRKAPNHMKCYRPGLFKTAKTLTGPCLEETDGKDVRLSGVIDCVGGGGQEGDCKNKSPFDNVEMSRH